LLSAICDDVDLGLEVVGFIEVLAAVQQACRSGSGKSRRVVDGEVERRRRVCDCSDRLGLANALATERSRQPRPAHERSPSNAIVPMRPPWLPDHPTAARPSMTLAACKVASSAIPS
jgi:hypothetical protein